VVSPDRNVNQSCATHSKLAALLAHAEPFSEMGIMCSIYSIFCSGDTYSRHISDVYCRALGNVVQRCAQWFIGEVLLKFLKMGIKMHAVVSSWIYPPFQ
jgi:hypothetical protein